MNDKIEILEPDWTITLKVWWSIVWRLFVYIIVAVIGFTWIPNIFLVFGLNMEVVRGIGSFFGLVVSVPISIVIIRSVLYMEFKEFKIAIIKTGHEGRRSQDTLLRQKASKGQAGDKVTDSAEGGEKATRYRGLENCRLSPFAIIFCTPYLLISAICFLESKGFEYCEIFR